MSSPHFHHTSPTYFRSRCVSIQLDCIRNPAGFQARPSVLVIAIARAVPAGGFDYYILSIVTPVLIVFLGVTRL